MRFGTRSALRLCGALALARVLGAATADAGDLTADDFKFDGPLGSHGATIEQVGTNHFRLTLGHAPNHEDWCNKAQFQIVRDAKGNSLRLDVVFHGGNAYILNEYFHSWSYDAKNWTPVFWEKKSKDSRAGDTLVFPTFTEDVVYVGHQAPMSYEDLRGLVEEWRKSPYVKVHVIGQSLGGRDLFRVVITDPASSIAPGQRWVHYFANQHPGEHNSQWRMVGMMDWLLSDDPRAADCRRRTIGHFIPMMSPDAPSHGWYRTNAQGVDMNRSYFPAGSDPEKQAHEAHLWQRDLERLMASAAPVTSIWALHTWGGVVDPIITPGPEMGARIGDWKAFAAIIDRHDAGKDLIKPLQANKGAKYGSSSWTDGPHQQFGITAVLCEGAAIIDTKEKNVESGRVLMRSIAEFWKGTRG